jgi:hypothetical protein
MPWNAEYLVGARVEASMQSSSLAILLLFFHHQRVLYMEPGKWCMLYVNEMQTLPGELPSRIYPCRPLHLEQLHKYTYTCMKHAKVLCYVPRSLFP